MNIVLVEPEISPNTGNVARLCAATKTALYLIEPFGFKLNGTRLKRAGMDYWQYVEWHCWKNWSWFGDGLCRKGCPAKRLITR
jgi:tRNA (cytidine/uridine-2'-O-)-methyltransferase